MIIEVIKVVPGFEVSSGNTGQMGQMGHSQESKATKLTDLYPTEDEYWIPGTEIENYLGHNYDLFDCMIYLTDITYLTD